MKYSSTVKPKKLFYSEVENCLYPYKENGKELALQHIKDILNEHHNIKYNPKYIEFMETQDVSMLPHDILCRKRKALKFLMSDPEYKEKLIELFKTFISDNETS